MANKIKCCLVALFVFMITYAFANNLLLVSVYLYSMAKNLQVNEVYLPATLVTNLCATIYAYFRILKH